MNAYRDVSKPIIVWEGPMYGHEERGGMVRIVSRPAPSESSGMVYVIEMSVEKDAMGQCVWVKPSWPEQVINTLARALVGRA